MSAYVERVARFLLSLLVSGLLLGMLAVAASRLPHGAAAAITARPPLAVGLQSLAVTAPLLGKAVLIALPAALLLGVPAGLRWWPRLEGGVSTASVVLAGLTGPLLGLSVFHVLQVALRGPMTLTAGWTVLALGLLPWLTLAIRDGLAKSGPARAQRLMGMAGALLQQTGNLTVVCLTAEATFGLGLGAGVYTAMLSSLMGANVKVLTGVLALVTLPVLLLQFAGDLLATAAAGPGAAAARRGRRWWTVLGAVLALGMAAMALSTFGPALGHPIMAKAGTTYWLGTDLQGRDLMALAAAAARTSLLRTAVATAVALVIGAACGSLGAATGRVGAAYFSPPVTSPSLFGPFLAGLWASVMFGMNPWAWVIALGAASSPAIAHAVRGYMAPQTVETRWAALRPVAGAAALVAAQALIADTALGFVRVRDGSLGVWALDVMSSWTNYRILIPAAVVAAGIAGLFLIGWGLTAVHDSRLDAELRP